MFEFVVKFRSNDVTPEVNTSPYVDSLVGPTGGGRRAERSRDSVTGHITRNRYLDDTGWLQYRAHYFPDRCVP